MKMTKEQARRRKKVRIRKKISGTASRPRLVVFRSNKYIYAQLVDDLIGKTVTASSSCALVKGDDAVKLTCKTAEAVGKDIAAKAKELNIDKVVFDRGGYIYHGRVKALADGAREGGLKF
ncbi:50S ribosomal protein L18 [Maridesulfovibrio ferrireducens]|jgi:large subunit ribosomal protein L18|uniref:50S ribosomal protein L18 n=1 Tax=Maridesulfovibrio ferrireducens TaxID=246191 RepID=UPI001A276C68|nr:50S ribosomal protein L18 [Maridesulfovibrio ferrireducens]MBI9110987.1 50S ribosomal protein L18 [Maridesulfovibrio ferrireducens]